jgi:hypothetical protein
MKSMRYEVYILDPTRERCQIDVKMSFFEHSQTSSKSATYLQYLSRRHAKINQISITDAVRRRYFSVSLDFMHVFCFPP